MQKIRWGIISTGGIANAFATALNHLDDAEIVAVGSRDQASADTFGDKHNIPRRYASYEELAHDPDLDVVYIGTPHNFHAANMQLCLNGGKHVLCEKAFTLNAAQAEACVTLARQKGLFVMEAMWMRFLPSIVQVRQWLAEGIIGELREVRANFNVRLPYNPEGRIYNLALGGGALLDVGIYPVSFASMVLGQPETVIGQAFIGETGVDEQESMFFTYSSGAWAQLSCGVHLDVPTVATIVGSKGYIYLHERFFCTQRVTLCLAGKEAQTYDIGYTHNGLGYEAQEVHACLRAGRLESSVMPLDESIAILRTTDALRSQWGVQYPDE